VTQVAAWAESPLAWPLALEYRGDPLQLEAWRFPGPASARSLFEEPFEERHHQTAGAYTAHVDLERPGWFYREASRVIFERLLALGYRDHIANIGEPDVVAQFARLYRGTVVGQTRTGRWLVSCPIAEMLRQCEGFPERRTLGSAWAYHRGGVIVREATDEELLSLPARLDALWGTSPRLEVVLRMLDRWVNLDRAQVLLSFVGAELADIPMIRLRHRSQGTLSAVSPGQPDSDLRAIIAAGLYRWSLDAGYTSLSTFIPTWQGRVRPDYRPRLERLGWSFVQERTYPRGTFDELLLSDLQGALSILEAL
jgi:hypothetical protein